MQIFLFYVLQAGVSILLCYKKNMKTIQYPGIYFMSYINLKFQKGNPKHIFCTLNYLKISGNSPAPKPILLKPNALNFAVSSRA